MSPDTLVRTLLGVLGLTLGSAVTALAYRLPREISYTRGRSACPHCGRTLGPADLIPLLSFMLQRGRCRSCGHTIGWRYPVTEAWCAAWLVLLFPRAGLTWDLLWLGLWGVLMVALFWIDLDFQLLPDRLTFPGMALGLLYALPKHGGWQHAGLGILVGSGFLGLVAWGYWKVRRVEGMGLGDIKLAAMMGAVLGWPYTLLAIFVASAVGSLWGLGLVLTGRGHGQTALPFGTLLAPAALVSLLWGPEWLAAYQRLLRGG